ncbi:MULTISPECIES: hypothetical protein [unclassified Pseudomonas]|uniref:hypothetical protein n=1 Tax=unclassified Pseudomonas TaxID=196821 RepID=UPI00244ACF62|nr:MULTISPECIES: hypothetical protein [unclassified Pseudomonas]MDG9925841.1 hypothetical protein [Pseudomonas sp. GD04045]MDH0034919.1 hypothetical protein [Pseudomonas sp. GD04019]
MLRAVLLALTLLLGACAGHTPVPTSSPALTAGLPISLQIERTQNSERRDWLLVIQAEGEALRWSLFDPLGVPLARQLLQGGEWRNDGLLPPNPEARELFAALLFALTADDALHAYPEGSWQRGADGQRRLNPDWRIRYRSALDFTLAAPQLSYRVRALNQEEGN